MADGRRLVGDEGEVRAEAFLRDQGFRILGRNVRSPLGELDLVADDHGVLVFVEVKRRQGDVALVPRNPHAEDFLALIHALADHAAVGDRRCIFYREQLRLLPGIGTRYELPARPDVRSRAELGLPAGPLAIVPQSIFKVLPHNDAIYARLLDARGDLRIAFFGADPTEDAARFRQRLREAVGARAAERLLFLPELSRGGFMETLGACDLMIDTMGWSGGNSALDALRMGLPIVTCAGEFMRGRQCATMLRLLGIEGAEATSPGTLAELALARIGDDGFRQAFRSRVDRGLGALVDDPACDRALTTHIENALAH